MGFGAPSLELDEMTQDSPPPFSFRCHRSGRCCTGGEGHVWLEEGESEAMAAALGLDHRVFEERFVRTVVDPTGGEHAGELRRALRETREGAGGRCVLLEGSNQCTVYGARPAHCATFPHWPSVLNTRAGFERARATCPGIRIEPTESQRQGAFVRLRKLYHELEELLAAVRPVCITRGACCRFEEVDHVPYATGLEADYAAAQHPSAPPPEAPGRCPYHRGGKCSAREGRPLVCRTYFCDPSSSEAFQATHDRLLAKIHLIEEELDYPRTYAPFPELLADRGIGAEPFNP